MNYIKKLNLRVNSFNKISVFFFFLNTNKISVILDFIWVWDSGIVFDCRLYSIIVFHLQISFLRKTIKGQYFYFVWSKTIKGQYNKLTTHLWTVKLIKITNDSSSPPRENLGFQIYSFSSSPILRSTHILLIFINPQISVTFQRYRDRTPTLASSPALPVYLPWRKLDLASPPKSKPEGRSLTLIPSKAPTKSWEVSLISSSISTCWIIHSSACFF